MSEQRDWIAEYLQYISVERALSKNTVAAYKRDLEKLSEYLAENSLSVFGAQANDVLAFTPWLRSHIHPPLSESSISRAVVTVRNLYRFIAKNSDKGLAIGDLRPPRIPKRLPKSLSVSQVQSLLSSAQIGETTIALRDYAIVESLYGLGARVSELVALDITSLRKITIDGRHSYAVRLRGKGNKEREALLGSFGYHAIEEYLVRARPELAQHAKNVRGERNALFLNSRGGRLSRQTMWRLVHDAAERAGIEEVVSPHNLRHSFATHLLDGGADIRVVQELLGHASVTTTQIYTLVTIDKIRESYSSAHPRARSATA